MDAVGAAGNDSGAGSAPLNILYSFPNAVGGSGFGGIAWQQVNQLVKAGHRVTLIAASLVRPLPGLAAFVRSHDVAGRQIPEGWIGRTRAYAWHDWRARRLLTLTPFDLVHTWPMAGARTLELARRLGVTGVREVPNTHIADACTAVSREYARLGLEIPSTWSKFLDGERVQMEEREYAAASALLVPSDAVAQSFLTRGFPAGILIRHRYGFDPAAIRIPVRNPGRPFTAVFIGRAVPRKGLHYALEAWLGSQATDTGRFLIYGAFDPDYLEMLRPSLEHPSIVLCGPTDKPGSAYSKADVLLLPSVEEGSALVTYEAQGAGVIPLVSSASGAMVQHGVNGLIHEPGDTTALTGHIDLVFESESARRSLRNSALAEAQLLTWDVAGRVLVDAYRQAMTGAREEHYNRPSERIMSGWDDSAVS